MPAYSKWIAVCPQCRRGYDYKSYFCRNCRSAMLLDPNAERGHQFARLICARRCGNTQEGLKCRCGAWITCAGLRWVQPVALRALRTLIVAALALLAVFWLGPLCFEHMRAWVVAH